MWTYKLEKVPIPVEKQQCMKRRFFLFLLIYSLGFWTKKCTSGSLFYSRILMFYVENMVGCPSRIWRKLKTKMVKWVPLFSGRVIFFLWAKSFGVFTNCSESSGQPCGSQNHKGWHWISCKCRYLFLAAWKKVCNLYFVLKEKFMTIKCQ